MEILKAKITKDNTLVATYKDENGTTTVEGKNLVTNDLKRAFSMLVPHMAFLCEQKEAENRLSLDELPDNIETILEVTGYTVGGDGDSKGVTVTGKRFLKSSKVLNLNTPFTKFNDENEQYDFQFELEQAIEQCDFEVREYLFNKKWKVVQQEFSFEDTPADISADPIEDIQASNDEQQAFKDAMKKSVTIITNTNKRTRKRAAAIA